MNDKDWSVVSDFELLELLKKNNKSAFDLIYTRYWQKLYLSAYSLLSNQGAAEDIVQEIMVSLWVRRDTLSIDNLNAYLYQSTRFQVFKFIRDNKLVVQSPLEHVDLTVPNTAETTIEMEELNQVLLNAVNQLPQKCKDIFLLRKFEDMSIREISERLALSPKTVENQLTIAFKKIKVYLETNSKEELLPLVAFVFLS